MRVGIVARRASPRATALAGDIRQEFAGTGVEVVVDEETAADLGLDGIPADRMDSCDLVVSIGGDGTFLFTARGAGGTPIMGVNLGEVGFLNAVAPDDAVETVRETVDRLRAGEPADVQEMPRLQATGGDWSLPPALNEVTVLGPQRGHGNGVDFEVRVDGALYSGGHADGVLVSTPTGSTAYNLSERGPLVHPDLGGFVVNEMCGVEGMPPLVVDADAEITVRIDTGEEAVAVADGRTRERFDPPGQVTLHRADVPVRIAGPELHFFTALGKLD